MGIADSSRWANLNNPYAYRNDNLRQLGFQSYASYLKSPLWAEIRGRVLLRANGECERCRKPATQVHHRAYDPATLRGESIHALTAVCSHCHQKAEMGQKPQPVERGTEAYTRMERANRLLYSVRKHMKYRNRPEAIAAKKAKRAIRRVCQRWNEQDDEAALAWLNR